MTAVAFSSDYDYINTLSMNQTNTTSPSTADNTTEVTSVGSSELDVWRVYVTAVTGVGVACVGVPCNILAIVVLAHFRSKSSAPFLLICLALSDTVYLLAMTVFENMTLMAYNDVIDPHYNVVIAPLYRYLFPVSFISQTASTYLMVVITLERYVVVSWPFLAKTLCSLRSARLAVLIVIIFCLTFHTPHYLAFSSYWRWNNVTHEHRLVFYRNDFGYSDFYVEVFYKWLSLAFNFLIPFVILCLCNTQTKLALKRNSKRMALNEDRQQRDTRLTIMIVSMTVIFFLCQLLAAVSHVLISGYNRYRELPTSISRFSAVATLVMIINAAINFAIYCVTGRKFRETFVRLFSPAKCCRVFRNCRIRAKARRRNENRGVETTDGLSKNSETSSKEMSFDSNGQTVTNTTHC